MRIDPKSIPYTCEHFNILFLASCRLNLPKKDTNWIYRHWKCDWYPFWVYLMYSKPEIRCCIFYNCSQWGLTFPYLLRWLMIYSFGINTDYGNRSQFDPYPDNQSICKSVFLPKKSPVSNIGKIINTHCEKFNSLLL